MLDKRDIEQRIEDTLNSLDGMSRAEANPFIYTRIQARLKRTKTGVERIVLFAGKPAFAFLVLVVVISTNLVAMLQGSNEAATKPQQSQFVVADEYHNNVQNLYDYENPEP
jgi:hypothetical protein